MQVRRATADDAATIAEFNKAMALETENKQLDDQTILGGVKAVINDPSHGYYLVVDNLEGRTIGCLGITYEWSDWRNGQFLWIQSVYIAPESRRQGAFQAMYKEVLKSAEDNDNVCGVRLYVEQDNERARSTYLALGMTKTHYDLLEIEV